MRKLVKVDFNENGDASAPGSLTVVVNDCERVQTGFLDSLRQHLISAGHTPTNEAVFECRDAINPPRMILRISRRCPSSVSNLDNALRPAWKAAGVLIGRGRVEPHNGGYVLSARMVHNS